MYRLDLYLLNVIIPVLHTCKLTTHLYTIVHVSVKLVPIEFCAVINSGQWLKAVVGRLYVLPYVHV